jgi:hypothetical protein
VSDEGPQWTGSGFNWLGVLVGVAVIALIVLTAWGLFNWALG